MRPRPPGTTPPLRTWRRIVVLSILAALLAFVPAGWAAAATSPWTIVPDQHRYPVYTSNGITVIAPNDVWVVGGGSIGVDDHPFSEHWNGLKWSIVTTPPRHPSGYDGVRLKAVAGSASNDLWAVGGDFFALTPLIEHWNGTHWSVVPAPNAGVDNELEAVAVVATNDVWATGGGFEHWDGAHWRTVPQPTIPNSGNDAVFSSVTAIAANDAWAVGQVNGTTWQVVPSPNDRAIPGNNSLFALSALPSGTLWSLGNGPLVLRTSTG